MSGGWFEGVLRTFGGVQGTVPGKLGSGQLWSLPDPRGPSRTLGGPPQKVEKVDNGRPPLYRFSPIFSDFLGRLSSGF